MELKFRNLHVTPEAPVSEWGFEGLLAAIERGDRRHWQRIARELRQAPRGKVAVELQEALEVAENPAMATLFGRIQQIIEAEHAHEEKTEVCRRLAESLQRSGLSRAGFAAQLGTSQSRLSTYLTGRVTPSATLMVRAERLAQQLPALR